VNLKEVTNWTGPKVRSDDDQAAFSKISNLERTGSASPAETAVAPNSNLSPGTYWARVEATASDGTASDLSNVGATALPIPIGPWEAANLIGAFVKEYGEKALADPSLIPGYAADDLRELRLVDVRPAFELHRCGYVRYVEQWLEGIQQTPGTAGTEALPYSGPGILTGNPGFMSDEQILEALPNKNATILFL